MSKKACVVFAALVLAVCLAPLAATLLGVRGENRENRPLAPAPKVWEGGGVNLSFFAQFDRWWADRFGLREVMVTGFNGLTMALAGDVLNPRVMPGREGMLFFTPTLEDYLGVNLLSDYDIARIAVSLRLQQEYAEHHGARFVFTIAPNKNTLYPEYMPGYLSPTDAPGNRERLQALLEEGGVPYLDLAAELAAHKDKGLLYRYRDTHWNQTGALIAYRALMGSLFPEGGYETYAGLEAEMRYDDAGDLHNMVLPSAAGKHPRPVYPLQNQYALEAGQRLTDQEFTTHGPENGLSLFVLRDSFGEALLPYLSNNAQTARYSARFPYTYDYVQGERPDAVILEIAERNLHTLLLEAPAMPALAADAPDGPHLGEIAVDIRLAQSGGALQIRGTFDASAYRPWRDRLLVWINTPQGERWYEAFPLLGQDREAFAVYGDTGGFTLTLPQGAQTPSDARLWIQTPQGAYASDSAALERPAP